jgi:hypothetical protein
MSIKSIETKAVIKAKVETIHSQRSVQSKHVNDPNSRQQILGHAAVYCKLPTITLTSFNGKYDQWIKLRDTFDALIIKTALTYPQKVLSFEDMSKLF